MTYTLIVKLQLKGVEEIWEGEEAVMRIIYEHNLCCLLQQFIGEVWAEHRDEGMVLSNTHHICNATNQNNQNWLPWTTTKHQTLYQLYPHVHLNTCKYSGFDTTWDKAFTSTRTQLFSLRYRDSFETNSFVASPIIRLHLKSSACRRATPFRVVCSLPPLLPTAPNVW